MAAVSRARLAGLQEESRRPKTSPNRKIFPEHLQLITELRKRKLGHRSTQNELARLHNLSFATATIHKALQRLNKPLLSTKRAFRKTVTRYDRPTPGDRVQMDVCKIAPGLYQYTAIDDCTRYKVLRLYSRRTASNTLDFLDAVIEEMPFAFQRIQTDRGREFFATDFRKGFWNGASNSGPSSRGHPI
jgi:transposase InsO family protein